MLKQTSINEVKRGAHPRSSSHIVVAMRYYPRFLRKECRDEYVCELAPSKELLHDFNETRKKLGEHNPAFAAVDYEGRFSLNRSGLEHLKRLSELSRSTDVYLSCLCDSGERCHREILLLMARKLFKARIGPVFHDYPVFSKRLQCLVSLEDRGSFP